MSSLFAIMTEATCGEACWSAKEEVCRCSCGGKNHGIYKTDEIPERTCKIQGFRYRLQGIGRHGDMVGEAENINGTILFGKHWDSCYCVLKRDYRSHLEVAAPARVRYATQDQFDKWKELEAYKGQTAAISNVALLWVRIDFDDLQSVYLSDIEEEVDKTMRDLPCSAKHWVWEMAKRRYPQADYRSPAWYVFLNKVIQDFPNTIAQYTANSWGSSDFKDKDFEVES
jgi:hypothetical protein